MANESTSTPEIERSYIDNYAIKEFVQNDLVPKYFPDIDVSLRTVGMIGLTTEMISNISEDGFNATSVLFREPFPNRAEMPESIYSHAAIFQLSNIFSSASVCRFLIVMEEEAIIKNMQYDKDSGIYYFYINKDLTIYVEDQPYVLDYDIRIRCVKKRTETKEDYIFAASYILGKYKNSISDIIDPYIKVRRSLNGYIALEVTMHQCERFVSYESIITNSKINLPTINVSFNGQLVGFDILYKAPEDSDYNTQLETLLVYSQPKITPFCYYQLYDDNVLRISFNAKDTYFIPKFNSELKIILYLSNGKAANFDVYNGTNISIVSDNMETEYDTSFLMSAKPVSSSEGGEDRLSLDALQSLAVEGYRTALALTTEPDLDYFFSNYKYRYGDIYIKFIKRRNDVYERIFGGYIIMKRDDYIYKTNTLNIKINLSDMENPEKNIYMIEPGHLFTYVNNDIGDNYIDFYRNPDLNNKYYQEYLEAVENGEIPYITDEVDPGEIPAYLNRPASFAEFKARKGYNDKVHVFDKSEEELELLDDPSMHKFLFMNPFLIRFKKSPNLVSLYMTFINQTSVLDFTNQNEDAFVQVIAYQLQIERYFTKEKKYTVTTAVMPSITIDSQYPVIHPIEIDNKGNYTYDFNNEYSVDQNDLRVLFVIHDSERPVCYSEMYPVEFTEGTTTIKYKTEFFTDDHITSDGLLRLNDDIIYRIPDTGEYYKVYDSDATLYHKYDVDGNIIESDIHVDDITEMITEGIVKKHAKLVNMTGNDDILIPMENVNCKIYTVYKRVYSEKDAMLIPATHEQTNNPFVVYDDSFDCYIWTNEYSTGSEPLTFIKPLNNVRSNLYFEDYMSVTNGKFDHDIMDIRIDSIPVVSWNIAYEEDNLSYFMNSFMAQCKSIKDIIDHRLRNETTIDVKFYNTYGKSMNYYIGDGEEYLDMLNLHIVFDMWFVSGTDLLEAVPSVKRFIKEKIETVNEYGSNQLHISNLMREIEHTFSYVDHIRFRGINDYSTLYQSVKLRYQDLNDMSKEERRKYIPEFLVADLNDIIINEYTAE